MAITIPDITTIQDITTILAIIIVLAHTIIATITTALITITITIVVMADGIIGTIEIGPWDLDHEWPSSQISRLVDLEFVCFEGESRARLVLERAHRVVIAVYVFSGSVPVPLCVNLRTVSNFLVTGLVKIHS